MMKGNVPGGAKGIPTAVQVLLINAKNEVLFQLRAGTGFFDGFWSLPGGHVESGESLFAAASRELTEELGITVQACDLHPIGVIHRRSDTNRIEFLFSLVRWQGTPLLCEPHRAHALQWAPQDTPPAPLVPYLEAIWTKLGKQWFFELGW
ncbi:MAG: NUDIX domain-containing protein [Hydrogenophilus thermoluteolus]|uniref:NUDIX domain-containing protein n=1 Tax=Hydrogenophilus thermoluteolus TaxID=297 RepID=UPI001C63D778|nr:NUDIX domain-containing protein [Hydrogenophilus thermoluteolus]MBW7656762.1 NUDIX domain-containing protein [Hydrogenophilus thermoluteolus]HNQ49046.1 NUDIX domain-containing protein [Hydrogenophilus thermoluteolus]